MLEQIRIALKRFHIAVKPLFIDHEGEERYNGDAIDAALKQLQIACNLGERQYSIRDVLILTADYRTAEALYQHIIDK